MKKYNLGIFITIVLLLGGCVGSAYDSVSIDTINKSILVANTELRGANLLFQNLLDEGVITSKSQAEDILKTFREAKESLTFAAEAVGLNNPSEAETELEKATGRIDVLIALLTPYANKKGN